MVKLKLFINPGYYYVGKFLSKEEVLVKKNCKGLPYKSYLLSTFVLLLMIGLLTSYSFGEGETKVKYGFSIFGGTGEAINRKPDMNVYGFLPRLDLALHRNWDLEFEGNYSYWNITSEKDLYFLGVNVNILLKPPTKLGLLVSTCRRRAWL